MPPSSSPSSSNIRLIKYSILSILSESLRLGLVSLILGTGNIGQSQIRVDFHWRDPNDDYNERNDWSLVRPGGGERPLARRLRRWNLHISKCTPSAPIDSASGPFQDTIGYQFSRILCLFPILINMTGTFPGFENFLEVFCGVLYHMGLAGVRLTNLSSTSNLQSFKFEVYLHQRLTVTSRWTP